MRAPAKEQPRRTTDDAEARRRRCSSGATADGAEARRRRCSSGQRRTRRWRSCSRRRSSQTVAPAGSAAGADGGLAAVVRLWRNDQQRDDSDETVFLAKFTREGKKEKGMK
ncbi:hypothetical protein Scep_021857 [Stephania cephalantha]|uniref:Uncharacterized protein n=1 Tax=Stephania cephalantha TaxID=152367 RepID=A0AAP0HX73_9MAGN